MVHNHREPCQNYQTSGRDSWVTPGGGSNELKNGTPDSSASNLLNWMQISMRVGSQVLYTQKQNGFSDMRDHRGQREPDFIETSCARILCARPMEIWGWTQTQFDNTMPFRDELRFETLIFAKD